MNNIEIISRKFSLSPKQVTAVLNLLNDGATIPFIARYRKEKTGGLDEEILRKIETEHMYLSVLEDRKETVLKSIEEQGKLTSELKNKILAAEKLQEVEDLYLPYKPKRKTRGTVAKSKGLEPLAKFILDNPGFNGNLDEILQKYLDGEKGVATTEEALQGAKDIIAENINESAEVRKEVREFLSTGSKIISRKVNNPKTQAGKKDVYEIYHDFETGILNIKPYQTLALNRGEREGFLRVNLKYDKNRILEKIRKVFFPYKESVFDDILSEIIQDAFTRLIYPSIEREVRNNLTEEAEEHAIEIFSSNLRQLLLQPPLSGKKIMGIDPGFVSGSKVAVIDETGKYLEGRTIYPHPPQNKVTESKKILIELINNYNVEIIAIGNGTASRETELFVSELIKENNLNCHYLIVNEAGASVYSASPLAKEEFPTLEASQRGNISIARRVLDPLAELVKIDPKSIGVGLYQHDVNQKLLKKKLDDVVVSCVNYVGVDLNTASAALLTYVSGMNKRIAKKIVEYRDTHKKFKSRKELKNVSGVGEKLFEQAAGFLKIPESENPLDNTFIHPESYKATEKLLEMCNVPIKAINEKGEIVEMFVKKKGVRKIAEELGIGEFTLNDIINNLKKPGRDPREEMPKPVLRSDVLKIEDLHEGMKLKGTVRNIVDFGAFVDIGIKQDALLHISEIADKYIKHPLEVLKVGDIIEVAVKNIDKDKGRVALTMKNFR